MQAAIYTSTTLIGHADLVVGDEHMGHLYGEFIPTPAYYTAAQKAVWDFWETASPDYTKWHSLNFNAQLANGCFLLPQGGYTITDLPELPGEPKRIDISGVAAEVLTDFISSISSEPPYPFVEEPWESLTIDQKLALELELRRELGIVPGSTSNVGSHPLARCRFSALCRTYQADDALFQLAGRGESDYPFAVVHLTWSRQRERNSAFPATTFYESFYAFKLTRMYPDRTDRED